MTATQRPPNIDEETRAFREWHAAVSRPPPGRFIFAGATMLSFDRTGKRRSALAWGETDAEMPWTRRRLEAGDGLGGGLPGPPEAPAIRATVPRRRWAGGLESTALASRPRGKTSTASGAWNWPRGEGWPGLLWTD